MSGADHSCPKCGEGCDCGLAGLSREGAAHGVCVRCSRCRRADDRELRERVQVNACGYDALSPRVRAELERAMHDDASLYHLAMQLRRAPRDQAVDIAMQFAIGFARGIRAVSEELKNVLMCSPARPIVVDSSVLDASRLASQAQTISVMLSDAGVPSMTIAEGVAYIIAENARLKGGD